HGDTTRPYVLGSLFNGRDTPGDDLLQGKDGSFALKSDAKIYTQSKDAYTIKSGKTLTIEIDDNVSETYGKDWTNQTRGTASLKATRPFEIEGQSVSVTGNADVSIEGMTKVELKCGGSSISLDASGVSISGPMVKLG